MATVSPSGSRAGLITALVIFVILFLVSSVLYITTNNALNKEIKDHKDEVAGYNEIISKNEMTALDPDVKKLREKGTYSGRTYYDILRAQRDELARRVTGQTGTTAEQAKKAQEQAVNQANNQLKGLKPPVAVPSEPVTAAIDQLVQAVLARQGEVNKGEAELSKLQDQMKKLKEDTEAQIKTFKDAIAAANDKAAAAGVSQEQYRTDKDKTIAQLEDSMKQKEEQAHKTAEDLNQQIAAAQGQITKLKKDLDQAIKQLDKYRTKDIAANMIRRVDGHIIQVDSNNVVYVDLGLGNQVTPGMTFQIYDKGEGIPRTGTNEDELPPGKGALEIVRVGPNSSECRILKMNNNALTANPLLPSDRLPSAEERVKVGDLIANAVYDRNTKFRFFVYGEFDIDRDNHPSAAETEMVKRLIVQFGGTITDKIGVDTDFVVMGREPEVPDVKPDDPVSKFAHDKALEELKKYEDVRDRATTLYIPVLNQNRFLYMIGYYDQAPRQVP